MCIIINRPEGAGPVPGTYVMEASLRNPDGFGVAWRTERGIQHARFGPRDYNDFEALLLRVEGLGAEFAAHFRLATHGPKVKGLAHPFTYQDREAGTVYVFHNGIIDISTKKHESDTEVFVRRVLSRLPALWWRDPTQRELVTMAAGWSRLLLMTEEETIRLGAGWRTIGGLHYSTDPAPSSKSVTTWGRELTAEEWGVDAESCLVPMRGDWWQNGHHITPITTHETAGEKYGIATCDVCDTVGDFYEIDGKTYIDVKHKVPTGA